MRFLMVDRVTELEPGSRITGVKCWTLSDDIFEYHFPAFPVVPGVLQIESMAQLLGLLVEESCDLSIFPDGVFAALSLVRKAKFRAFVIPGDRSEMEGTLDKIDRFTAQGRVVTRVDGTVRSEAHLTFALADRKKENNPALEAHLKGHRAVLLEHHRNIADRRK